MSDSKKMGEKSTSIGRHWKKKESLSAFGKRLSGASCGGACR